MILVAVEIENYKQFAGLQRFTPGPNGVVGIIGTNGAGKSTLFEAIEWCLYGSQTDVRSDEIPPRGNDGLRPRVKVRLQHPTNGATFDIERSLRKSGATAELAEITADGDRSIIATSPTAVTTYTASKLIGLPYKAFVATFFTRQKELSFFGTYTATERRREVGRLLGLETIRVAQTQIAEERTAKKNYASGLQAQYEQESGERDFDADRMGFLARQAEIDTVIAQRLAEQKAADSAFTEARNAHSLLVEKHIEAQKLTGERGRLEVTLRNAEAAIAAAQHELDQIAAAHAERQQLSEQTSAIEAIGADVMRLELLKERADHLAQLKAERESLGRERERLIGQIRSALVPGYEPWAAVAPNPGEPVKWIDALLAADEGRDAARTEAQLAAINGLLDARKRLADAEAKLEKCRTLATQLQTRLSELLAEGDPDRRDAELNDARTEAERTIGAHNGSIASHRTALADYDSLLVHDHAGLDGSICPTCLRGFTPEELTASRAALQERKAGIEAQISNLTAESTRLKERIAVIDRDLATNRTRRDEIAQVRQRLANGEGVIAETERELAAIHERIDALADGLDADLEPTEATVATLSARLETERNVQAALPLLSSLRESLVSLESRAATNAGQIDEIGEVLFDPTELTEARARQQAARSALERMNFLDQLTAREPEHQEALTRAEQTRAESAAEIGRLDQQLAGVSLDQAEIDRSEMNVNALQQKAQQARTQVELQRRERDKVDRELAQVDIDQKKLEAVATRADAARVEADDLDYMYREFNEFEKYVARRVRPQLEDMTSELVRVITENKYESVELDDNYGICVWDGDLGRYPMEHFSGGERDVIALSARMALSRLIGSQAANPPSFMVLDEVFGSLDRDRRANVLNLLSSLAGSAESFQQLFVISHVDDVRLSPAFTEVWRVAEADDGTSRLENLNMSMGMEDI